MNEERTGMESENSGQASGTTAIPVTHSFAEWFFHLGLVDALSLIDALSPIDALSLIDALMH
jgi:hypothetical protein